MIEVKSNNLKIEKGLIYFHAPWSGYSCANLVEFRKLVDENLIMDAYMVNVDLDFEINRIMYQDGGIQGYGEIAIVNHGSLVQAIKYRNWDKLLVGQLILETWKRI